jgi:hypothetical protein
MTGDNTNKIFFGSFLNPSANSTKHFNDLKVCWIKKKYSFEKSCLVILMKIMLVILADDLWIKLAKMGPTEASGHLNEGQIHKIFKNSNITELEKLE